MSAKPVVQGSQLVGRSLPMNQGFTENPFSSHLVEPARGGYIFAGGSAGLDGLMDALRRNGWRGELCGPHGAGKSTLLTDIGARLEAEGLRLARWRCADDSRLLPKGWMAELSTADVIILDGGERLFPGLLGLLRGVTSMRGTGLIMTTHKRRGVGACIPIAPNAEALAAKVRKLRGNYPAEDGANLARDMHERLSRHGGSAREVLFELYMEHEEQG